METGNFIVYITLTGKIPVYEMETGNFTAYKM